ncbi:uncharacterized protein LOC134792321 [Cydia splendana]|uniref:uncharacterized protein LOC134792321 n=1 Tax=Cydia splendana TaxID=1100963 RepID=UPI00300C395B
MVLRAGFEPATYGFEGCQKDVEDTSYQLQARINESAEPAIARSSTETRKRANLPKITIPIFTGEYESWYSFHDLFKNLIHNDATLSNTEKMQYLKTHLKGISDILLRWRKHEVAFMADLEKMYRFIKVHESDLKYQRILWRWSTSDPIEEYALTTVTYGTASAPYLAVRTLQQLARDEQESYPLASKTTLHDFYVDDILSGADSKEKAKILQDQLVNMLNAGGFNLRKWSSNKIELLNNIPEGSKEDDMIKLPQHETRKSLGVMWSPAEDNFHFQIKIANTEKLTKRFLLSEISKIFDPMGWLAPIIVEMKLLIQELWTNGIDWDTPVDEAIKKRWEEFYTQIKTIETIRIPRWIKHKHTTIELHGFSDASEKAYGTVIYSRIKMSGQYYISLLQAKSKVAPKKTKSTLPRLELCAAHLLSKLIIKVKDSLDCDKVTIHCYTDSMITIGWIKGEAGKWQTFVANRVSEIQRSTPTECWNHVKTTDNPADVLSRGIEPRKLEHHELWWKGPSWLQTDEIPHTKTTIEKCQEIENNHVTITENKKEKKIWERFSRFQRMIRVLSFCYRITQKEQKGEMLTYVEIQQTTGKILKLVQQEAFAEEYESLKNNKAVTKKSKLRCLDPFIGDDGLIRVGGRLHHSQLPYNQKHPIILPHHHHVSRMLIDEAHLQTLHGGIRLTIAFLRQKYWILGLKRMTKANIRNCVRCIRYKAATASQKMGQLPEPRVTPSQTFSHTGVDMAGPIQVRTTKGRGNKATKGYIAVFVCLATKAIHLELVGDLSTESFIAAFIRFKARRGHISHIYSDNGRNFVGAARMLHTQLLEIMQTPHVQNAVTSMGTQWHFNPPLAPHFGGIWEAGVKAMKHHLKRVIGESTLTYEELSTLLSQVETCLNSRPLCAQSDDINDNTVLTPSHFLIGREAVGIPDPINDVSTNLQQRWKLIQKMKKDFWKTWSRDYLHQLQQRYKWQLDQGNIKKGTVVLIKDENVTPSQWPLAKVIETHPGADGKTRVLTLQKAPGNCLKRAVHKVIPLPNNEEDMTETQQVDVNSNIAQLTPVNATSDQSNRTFTKESRRRSNQRTGPVAHSFLHNQPAVCSTVRRPRQVGSTETQAPQNKPNGQQQQPVRRNRVTSDTAAIEQLPIILAAFGSRQDV